jgi:hypothetical protein
VRYARSPVALLNQLADKAKGDADADATTDAEAAAMADEPLEFTPPGGDHAEVTETGPPLAYGDPSLN